MYTRARTFRFVLGSMLLASALGSAGCEDDDSPESVVDAGRQPTPAKDGGVCCPVDEFEGCNPTDLYFGGWARTAAACEAPSSAFDGAPFRVQTDAHGCRMLSDANQPASYDPELHCCNCVPPDADDAGSQ